MNKLEPTTQKTKENDYLAADGLWYPSNKLEGYLAQPIKLCGLEAWLNTCNSGTFFGVSRHNTILNKIGGE